jgi:ectoine hydroxylase
MTAPAGYLQPFQNDGYVVFPILFSDTELAILKDAQAVELAVEGPRRVVENDGKTVRSVYGSHETNEVLRRLACHPRLVEPARRMLKDEVYVYQFKINAKLAFGGDVWEWHQDYIFWQQEDGMPKPNAVTAAIFLDDVTEFNGPLFLIPGSHKEGVLSPLPLEKRLTSAGGPSPYEDSPEWVSNLTAQLKYSLDKECVARLVDSYGMVAPKGRKGTTLFFDPNMAHGSPGNISPFDRMLILITYNSVANVPMPMPGKEPRPEFLCSRDHRPIVPEADDVLVS